MEAYPVRTVWWGFPSFRGNAFSDFRRIKGHEKDCVYVPSKRGRRCPNRDKTALLEDRLARMETFMQGATVAGSGYRAPASARAQSVDSPLPSSFAMSNQSNGVMTEAGRESTTQRANSREAGTDRYQRSEPTATNLPRQNGPAAQRSLASIDFSASPMITPPHVDPYASPAPTTTQPDNSHSRATDKEEIVIPPEKANWEHLGPASWISICSQPGLRWVSERIGGQGFAESAKGLTLGWSRRLKFQWDRNRTMISDLDVETAWKYSTAYFEDSFEAIFGVVYRPEFESRLQAHFEGSPRSDEDVSWYALRNAVYATGCRALLAKRDAMTFVEAQAQSWQYFENALSVHTELLYTPTGLLAVQALAVMNFYLEGVGNPALEYMMCSGAARLAQSKGLHRQPSTSWNLSSSEVLHRMWLWWAIYCCEKQITHRSGRPSAINDGDISCQIPTSIVPGSTIDIEICTHVIKHAQISSQICERLLSVRGFQETPTSIVETVAELSQKLQYWRESLPPSLQPGRPIRPSELQSTRQLTCVIYLHFAYYGSLTAIHTIFFYPWLSANSGVDKNPAFHTQVSLSSSIVADAARNIILITKKVHIDAASPQWLAFYYPMVGLINLFLYILKYPSLRSAASDIALLDIAVGHFGHLEIVTSSELSFPFTREVAALAYKKVKEAKMRPSAGNTRPTTPFGKCAPSAEMDSGLSSELDTLTGTGFDMEDWNIFAIDGISTEGDMIYFPS